MLAKLVKGALVLDRPLGGVGVEFGSQQAAQQDVTDLTIVGASIFGPSTVEQCTLQTRAGCGGCRLTIVIRLNCAHRHQGIGPASQSVSDQKFEPACLVASSSQAGQIVALEPQLGSVDVSTEIRQWQNWCRQLSQRKPRPRR